MPAPVPPLPPHRPVARALAAVVALAISACGGSAAPPAEEPDEHEAPLAAYTDAVVTHRHVLGAGDVAVSSLPPFTVGEDVTVTAVDIRVSSGDATLVEARIDQAGPPAAARCVRRVAAASAVPAAGAALKAGSTPSLVLYLRGSRAVVDSIVVRYAHGDERTELRWNAVRVEITPRRAGQPNTCAA